MRNVFIAIVAACAAAAAAPAAAGWQGLRWGSTSTQVMQLKKIAKPHEADPADGNTYATAPYTVGSTTFSAAYRFTSDKLNQVHLTLLEGSSCADLTTSLKSKYGKPISEDATVPNTWIWQDKAAANSVTLKVFADTFCTVDYEPLVNSLARGL